MLPEDFLLSVSPFIRRHLVPIALCVIGVILILVGFFPLVFKPVSNNEVVFEQGLEHEASVAAASNVIVEEKIQVDVAGAVAKPGVYGLSSDARIQDAITASGGFSDKANTEWIAKNLNLAAKLSDATKIYVPFEGEEFALQGDKGVIGDTHSSGKAGSGQAGTTGLININAASQAQLEALPGIGPVTAQKIISNRPYSSVDDLLTKKVVGQSVFGKIKAEITVN